MKIKLAGFESDSRKQSAEGAGFSEKAVRGIVGPHAISVPLDIVLQPEAAPVGRHVKGTPKETAASSSVHIKDQDNLAPQHWRQCERLQNRFLIGGHLPMPEFELLELLLFDVVQPIVVKPLASRLLAEFGDLNGVVAATEHRLMKIDGATPKVYLQLRITEAFAQRMGQAKVLKREVVSSWDDLITYCRTSMAHRGTEQFRVFFLNNKNAIVADEVQANGTVDHVPVYPREVAKRALELNASAIIMVHNHPSGDTKPSLQDIEMTNAVSMACQSIGVTIHDHVIIGKGTEFSFRSMGLFAIPQVQFDPKKNTPT